MEAKKKKQVPDRETYRVLAAWLPSKDSQPVMISWHQKKYLSFTKIG